MSQRPTPVDDERNAKHFWECWEGDQGPGKKLRDSVEGLRTANVALNATVRTVGRLLSAAVAVLTLAVLVLGYMSSRERDRQMIRAADRPALINQARAEVKGVSP